VLTYFKEEPTTQLQRLIKLYSVLKLLPKATAIEAFQCLLVLLSVTNKN
jgi:hypothetical protein